MSAFCAGQPTTSPSLSDADGFGMTARSVRELPSSIGRDAYGGSERAEIGAERVGVSAQGSWAETGSHTYVDFLMRDAAIVLRARTGHVRAHLQEASAPWAFARIRKQAVGTCRML